MKSQKLLSKEISNSSFTETIRHSKTCCQLISSHSQAIHLYVNHHLSSSRKESKAISQDQSSQGCSHSPSIPKTSLKVCITSVQRAIVKQWKRSSGTLHQNQHPLLISTQEYHSYLKSGKRHKSNGQEEVFSPTIRQICRISLLAKPASICHQNVDNNKQAQAGIGKI